MSTTPEGSRRSPWTYVPTLYVLQGIPYNVVVCAANVFLAAMGVPVDTVGKLSSDLTLPWTLKPLWSPLVDLFGTKRGWLIASAMVCVLAMIGLAYTATLADVVSGVTLACIAIAIASATNDVATDGYYIHALPKTDQEFFVGVRSAAWRLGLITVMGGAVFLAGWLFEKQGLARGRAWAVAFLACAGAYAFVTAWHLVWLPRPASDGPTRTGTGAWKALGESLRAYFRKPGIVGAIVFVLFYRAGESLLAKMIAPFLLAERTEGGAGLLQTQYGWAYGTVGVAALVLGGVLGGVVLSRFGLRRCLWPFALAMHAPNLLYAWAAHAQPGLAALVAVIGVEQFGYGLGLTAYLAALLTLSRGTRHSTTHYAFSTGLMALSAWLIGRYSGVIVKHVGFETFFWIVSGVGLLALTTLPFVPRENAPSDATPPSADDSGR